jgi:hypothetical protein
MINTFIIRNAEFSIIIFLSEGTSVTHARVGDLDYQQKNLTARFAKVYAKDAKKKEKKNYSLIRLFGIFRK